MIEHVKTQNWMAVALDFIIVVVGVFIGIQVSNLNDARATREMSDDFAERLTTDLELESWQYAYLTEYYDDVLANADRALAILQGDYAGTDEDLVISAYRATQFTQNDHSRSTFDEIISAGAIGLIRDQELRNTAMIVYGASVFDEIYDTVSVTPYRELFRSEISSVVQDTLLAECGDKFAPEHDYNAIIDSLDYPCETSLPEEAIALAANTIRDNEDFMRKLRLHRANLLTQVDLLTRWYPDIRNGLQRFRRE